MKNKDFKESISLSENVQIVNFKISSSSKRKKVWEFLNSSLFIWFLSSVIVVIVSNWYNDKRTSQELMTKKTVTTQRLNSEISYRIFYSIRYLEFIRINNKDSISSKEVYVTTYNILDNYYYNSKDGGVNYSLYNEYFPRPFSSLLFELKSLDTSSVLDIQKAFEGFNDLDNFIALGKYEKQLPKEAANISLNVITKKILSDRWQSSFINTPFIDHIKD